MIVAIIFAQVWSVLELLALTSLARTVRVRTVFAAMAAGFYLIGPITAFIQLSWIHLAAPLFGMAPSDLQDIASYTADPFIEEAMKLLPLLVLLLIPAIRRQWSISDFVLIAAATGSGFGLTEHLFRFAADAFRAQSVSGGWVIVGGSNALVPSFVRTMTSWLNNGVFYTEDPTSINWHLAWSALGGLAVGLIVRKRTRPAILTAIGILLFIGVDHAYDNVLVREVQHSWLAWVSGPLHFLTVILGVLVFAAIVAAWWLDEPLRRATMESGPLLAAEQAAPTRVVGTCTAALSRLPWSLPWVAGFDRQRRAFHAAHIAEVEGRERMLDSLVAERDAVDAKLTHAVAPPLVPAWANKATLQRLVGAQLTRPSVLIWLVVTAPPFLFLIIGGWPETAWVQRVLTGRVIWQLVVLITMAGQARLAWGVYGGLRKLPATARLPLGDDAAMLGLQLACSVGAVALGGFSLARIFSGVGASDHLLSTHAADAARNLTASSGSNISNSANGITGPSASGSPDGGSASGSSSPSGNDAGNSGDPSDSNSGNQMSSSSGRSGESSSSSSDSNSGEDVPYGPPAPNMSSQPDEPVSSEVPSTPAAPAPNPNPLPPPPLPDDWQLPPDARMPDGSTVAPNPNPLPPPPPPPSDPDLTGGHSGDDGPNSTQDPYPRQSYPPGEDPAEENPGPPPPDGPEPAHYDEDSDSGGQDPAANEAELPEDGPDPDPSEAETDDDGPDDEEEEEPDAPAPKPEIPRRIADHEDEPEEVAATSGDDSSGHADAPAAKDASPADQSNNVGAAGGASRPHASANPPAHAKGATEHHVAKVAPVGADAQAAADDATKKLAEAQKRENDAFFGKDAKAYQDARAALDAAKAQADAAQAAADAARKSAESSTDPYKKP